MWPWEHAIVGYLVYSTFCHVVFRDAPNGREALAVLFASVFPDLVDKPLAWEFGVFDAAYAIGHSIFVAVPLSIVVGLVARRVGRSRVGFAFGVGYLLHLPADVVDGYVRQGIYAPAKVLWPVETVEGSYAYRPGFTEQFVRFLVRYRYELFVGELPTYLWVQLGLTAFAALLWLYDGAPILRECLLGVKRLVLEIGRAIGSLDDSPNRR